MKLRLTIVAEYEVKPEDYNVRTITEDTLSIERRSLENQGEVTYLETTMMADTKVTSSIEELSDSEREGVISVPKRKYEYLLKQEQVLNALQAAGVDNWEGYEEAIESVNSIDEPQADTYGEE